MEGETVRSIETFRNGLDLGLAVLLHNGGDFVAKAGADKQLPLVAAAEGAGGGETAGIGLDVEACRQLELGGRQLVGGRRQRRTGDGGKLGGILVTIGAADQWRSRRQRLRGGWWCCGWWGCWGRLGQRQWGW